MDERERGRAGGERASGVVAMRRRRMRRRRDDGEVTEKKTETDGELSAGMRLVDQRKREGSRKATVCAERRMHRG